MKQLIVLRGIPGSGKSTFVKDFGLEPYVISTDSLRMLFKNLNLGEDGQLSIDQSVSKEVFGYIDELLDKKMRRGEYIIIDATHTSTQSIQRYIPLSQKYGYKVFVVDFTDVSLAACIERNKKRESYKFVPEEVIKRMHEQLITSELPREVTLTTPAQFLEATKFSATDLSHYQTIHHIGDIQGVYAPLKEYFDTYPYSESDYYIFTGDLVDRGNENDEVVRLVLELLKKDNVVLIEGNHDTHLYNWSVGRTVKSDEFNLRTAPQLEQSNIHRKEVSSILRKKMISCLLYTYGDKKVLVTHGGLSALPERLERISDATIIRGSGSYESVDTVGDQFCKRTDSDTYAIHGHRNMQILPTQSHERVFNLEGKVEFGGDLRVVQLTSQGFEIVEIPAELKAIATSTFPENTEFLEYLRSHKHINERVLLGNISSFNFSRELFQSKNWNDQTIKARGLFLNITTQEIIIRSYNKFFNINEVPESSLRTIEVEWQFPVTVWRKENGCLGLIGYDSSTDNLIFSSKSSTESEHRYWFERIITKTLDDEKLAKLKTYLKHNNAAMVCECIDPYNDPHIIDEDKKRVVLLDVVRRTQEFSRIDQDKQIALAEELGLTYKVKSTVLNSYQELLNWYNSVSSVDYNEDGKYYEGYVLEDPTGRMTKIKCEYYSFWKRMRPIITNHKTLVNTTNYNKFSRPELAESFLEFVRLIKPHLEHNIDVITMRRLYYTLRK